MANVGLRQRFLRGFGATSLGPVVTAAIQLGTVPVLLHAWGAAKYGDWLLLSAIPSYLGLSDLGFGNASGSEMAMQVAAEDRQGALETFQSSWVLVTLVSIAALVLGFLLAWWVPWQHWLKLSDLSSKQAAGVILLLGAQVVICQQCGIAESGYRSDGYFASGQFLAAMMRLSEALGAMIAALMGAGVLGVACTYLVVRSVGTIGYILLLRRLSPWLHYGIHHARLDKIKRMVAPAFGFMTMPLGFAMGQQGLLLVIGAKLGPIAVVSFSTLRTLSRITYQLNTSIKNALWPELSRAFGSGNISLARRLHRYACQASLLLSVVGGGAMWVVGPYIYRFWIRQHVTFDATCFHVLLFVGVTTSLWDMSSVIPMSANSHCRIAANYAAASAVSLGIAALLVPHLGISGAAITLVAVDMWMTGLVMRTSLHLVQDTMRSFAGGLLVVPRFAQNLRTALYGGALT
jgi:O-antigen/teichoic acid export membrane protein